MPEKFKRLSARLKRLSEHKRINLEPSIERSEQGVCLPVWAGPKDSPSNVPIDLGGLPNKHGYYRDEHRCRGKGNDDPTQTETRLTLHEFVGGLQTMLDISRAGKERSFGERRNSGGCHAQRYGGRCFHSLRSGGVRRPIGSSFGRRSNIWLLEIDDEHPNQHNECHESQHTVHDGTDVLAYRPVADVLI
jgi:hypothetical protein